MSDWSPPAVTPQPPPGPEPWEPVPWWKSPWVFWNVLGVVILAAIFVYLWLGRATDVGFVRNTRLQDFGDAPLGDVLDQFMNNPQWEATTDEEGQRYVAARGRVRYMSKSSLAVIRFRVGGNRQSIGLAELKIDGQVKTTLVAFDFLRKAYGAYEPVLLKR